MENKLAVVDTQNLSTQEMADINGQVDALITRQKNNRHEIYRLVFDGALALTAGDKSVKQKSALGFFKRHFTGKSTAAQNDINKNLVTAQYAAQQTLQKLAEQNLMSFELIAAVNNKLNAAALEVNGKVNDLAQKVLNFFKRSRAKVIELEQRLNRVEQNVNLLNWQNSIEYQMYDGVEYQDLDDAAKIVCIVRDFYDINNGAWNTSDLLLLKTAMNTIGLNPKLKISCENFIRQLGTRPQLFRHLVGEDFQAATEYETIIFGVNKFNRLAAEESYLVATTENLLAKSGITLPRAEIIWRMTDDFVRQETGLNLSAETTAYEFILELLCNLAQLQAAKNQRELDDRQAKLNTYKNFLTDSKNFSTRELFLCGININALVPIVLERAEGGDIQARYMAADMQRWSLIDDRDRVKEWLAQNISAGDLCSMFCGWSFGLVERDELKKHISKLTDLADGGDVFAQYELGSYYDFGSPPPPEDCKLMAKYHKMAAEQGFAFAQFEFGFYRYHLGWGGEKDNRKAIEWLMKAHNQGLYQEKWIATCYGNLGEHDEQIQWLLCGLARDERKVVSKLGEFYYRSGGDKYKNYAKAIDYYKRSIELGDSFSGYEEYYIAEMYLEGGYGITASRSTAREWMKKAAAEGYWNAKKWLEENPY